MAEYKQIVSAGNVDARNAFRMVFSGADHSDVPQLQAWDTETLSTTTKEILVGTTANGNKSQVCAVDTETDEPGANWATDLPVTSGGAQANRLKGAQSYVLLGEEAPVAPFPVHRRFNVAFAVCSDNSPGTVGFNPKLAVKVFYAGAPPTVAFEVNIGTEEDPDWQAMTSSAKNSSMASGVANAILPTGAATTGGVGGNNGSLDFVTKPGDGEAFAPETWIRTL